MKYVSKRCIDTKRTKSRCRFLFIEIIRILNLLRQMTAIGGLLTIDHRILYAIYINRYYMQYGIVISF